jgi:pimeloyl-ACP methyl ester carboxylesterase
MRVPYQLRNVEVREEGRGPILVLIHGYPLDGDMWSPVSRLLAPKFRVLRPDLPSRRDTPRPPDATMKEYAAWIAAVVEASGAPAGLVGFSMGGYVLLEYLRSKPERARAAAFVGSQAGADDEAGRRARNRAIFTAREMGPGAISERMVPRLLSPAGLSAPGLAEAVRAIVRRQNPNSIENDLLAMRDRADSTDLLRELQIPVLAVAGGADALVPPERTRAIAEGSVSGRYVEIPGAGHLSPMESPAEVASALSEFFGAHLA